MLVSPDKSARGRGRPTAYKPEYDEQVYKLCLMGATDKAIADFFNVAVTTVNQWKKKHPGFTEALKKGKQQADMQVASALYNKALGYTLKKQKAFKVRNSVVGKGTTESVEVVTVEETFPPDTSAAIFWLKNRNPQMWREKQEVDHTSKGEKIQHISLGSGIKPDDK